MATISQLANTVSLSPSTVLSANLGHVVLHLLDLVLQLLSRLVRVVDQLLGIGQLALEHRPHIVGVLSPFAAKEIEISRQLTVLSLEEADLNWLRMSHDRQCFDLFNIRGQSVVEIAHFFLFTFARVTDG